MYVCCQTHLSASHTQILVSYVELFSLPSAKIGDLAVLSWVAIGYATSLTLLVAAWVGF